jgi:quercetin dioxygenase-like cupin family protein
MMRRASLAAALLSLALAATPALAHEADHGGGVVQRLSQPLQPGLDEGVLLVVTLAPGEASPAHRHRAHAFVYMLEGEVLMQVAGGPEHRLRPGDVFAERPDDIHTQALNLSRTAPARFAVFMVKKQGAPVVLPAD